MSSDDSDEFYDEYTEKYDEFMNSMSEDEKEIYFKIKEDNILLGRLNIFDSMKYDIMKIDTYDEIIISGKYELFPGNDNMHIIKVYKKENEWFIQIDNDDKSSITIPVTDNELIVQTLNELSEHEFIETDEYFYRIIAKEIVKSGKEF
jgi:hypothetical protein